LFFLLKNRKIKPVLFKIGVIVAIFLITLSAIFPLENLFINFETAEDVFKYTENGDIKRIIDGKNSSMVIFEEKGIISHTIIPRNENVFKIPSWLESQEVSSGFFEKGIYRVSNLKNTSDYYVLISFGSGKNKSLSLLNKNNQEITLDIVEVVNTGFCYFYVENLSEDHRLIIGEETIRLIGN